MRYKRDFFFILFLIWLNLSNGQEVIKLDNIYNTSIKNHTYGYKKTITSSNNNKLYFADFESSYIYNIIDKKDSLIKLYSFGFSNKKTDSLCLSMKNYSFNTDFTSGWFINFFVSENEKYVFINNNNCIIVFRKENKAEYVFHRRIKTSYYYDNIKQFDKENFLFSFCYNSNPLDQKERVVFSKYNINNDSVSVSVFPNYRGIEFSHLINNWIEIVKNRMYFSNTLDYKIRIYDKNLVLIDSISRNILSWTKFNIDSATSSNTNLKQFIENLYELDQKLYRVEKIIPFNKSNIFVSYKDGEGKDFRSVDLWKWKKGKMILTDSNIRISTKELFLTSEVIMTSNRPFPELIYSNDIYSCDNYLYVMTDCFCPFSLTIQKTNKQMTEACGEFYKEKGRIWGINVFKYNR